MVPGVRSLRARTPGQSRWRSAGTGGQPGAGFRSCAASAAASFPTSCWGADDRIVAAAWIVEGFSVAAVAGTTVTLAVPDQRRSRRVNFARARRERLSGRPSKRGIAAASARSCSAAARRFSALVSVSS